MSGYVNPDGSPWVPAFPGQRPPFQPGHRLSIGNRGPLKTGVHSARHVLPLAREIAAELRKTPGCDYLNTARFASVLQDYATAEARRRLLADYVDARPLEEVGRSADGEPLLEQLRQLEVRVFNLAERLGLSPVVPPDVQALIDASRKTLARRQERKQFAEDLRQAAKESWYGDE